MRRTRSAAATATAVGLLLPHVASAATTNIKLSISGCVAASIGSDRLFDTARAELAPRMLGAGEEGLDAAGIHLYVRLCQGSANGVMLQLYDHGELRALRQVDLSDVAGDLRIRTLAVAIAELIAATPERGSAANVERLDSSTTRHPAAPSAPPSASNVPSAMPAEPEPQRVVGATPRFVSETHAPGPTTTLVTPMRLSLGAGLREFLKPRTTLVGPWLGLAWRRLSGEAQLLLNRQDTSLGSIALYNVNLAAMYQVLSLGSQLVGSAHLRTEVGQIWAQGAANARAGIAEHSDRVTHLALALHVKFESAIQRHLSLSLHVQAGAARGVAARVEGQTIANTQGAFLGVSLGLSYAHFI